MAPSPIQRFEEYLKSKGKRVTQPRRILIEHLFRHGEHYEGDELIDELSHQSRGSERVSRPTVYRTLSELVEAGLLRKVEIGGRLFYEHDQGNLDHDDERG